MRVGELQFHQRSVSTSKKKKEKKKKKKKKRNKTTNKNKEGKNKTRGYRIMYNLCKSMCTRPKS